jgi:D-citramalate synthase
MAGTEQRFIEVMDSTLRDGEQMQDGSFTSDEKLTIARMLIEDVGVNRVEIASALVSRGEEEAARKVLGWAHENGHAKRVEVLGFTDKTASVRWLTAVGATVMNLLAKGSLNHLTKQLRKSPEEHIRDILETIENADLKGIECNIYFEDWSNGILHSPDYVYALLDRLKATPIRRFLLPDTLGVLCPSQVAALISELTRRYPDLWFEFHGHNDYGLATANTLAAVEAGVRGIHVTVNGVGERAGNTPLDEAVVGIHDFLGLRTTVDEKKLCHLSETVEIFSGRRLALNKPISGINVFTQTAGIHADGDRKANLYASRLLPERFNRRRQYALGKLSGKSNLEYNLKELGIELTSEQKKLVLNRIIMLGDRKAKITKEDLPYIISDILETPQDRRFVIRSCVVVSSLGLKPIATVKLAYREKDSDEYDEYEESAQGDGGYDAFMKAIRKITTKLKIKCPMLADYQVSIPSGGMSDALVQCSITWRDNTRFVTKGVNSDQVIAAAEATEKMLNIVAMRQ